MYRQCLCTFHPSFPNGNSLHNQSTMSKPGNWHWFKLYSLFRFQQLYRHTFMCMCEVLYNLFALIAPCNHYHNQQTSEPMSQDSFILYSHSLPTLFLLPNSWKTLIHSSYLGLCYFINVTWIESCSMHAFEIGLFHSS